MIDRDHTIIKDVYGNSNYAYDAIYTYCALEDKPGRTDLQYQQIETAYLGDNLYQCLNRMDENPFDKSSKVYNDTDVSTLCNEEGKRWCLGYDTEQCVLSWGEYLEVIKKTTSD